MTDKQRQMPFWMMPAVLMLLCALFLAVQPMFIQAPGRPVQLSLTEVSPHAGIPDSRSDLTLGVPLIKE